VSKGQLWPWVLQHGKVDSGLHSRHGPFSRARLSDERDHVARLCCPLDARQLAVRVLDCGHQRSRKCIGILSVAIAYR